LVVYSCLNYKRGSVIDEESSEVNPTVTITGELPVAESFGFDAYMKEQTSGQAFPSLSFLKWATMTENLSDQYVTKTRIRKGLDPAIPPIDKFLDKL